MGPVRSRRHGEPLWGAAAGEQTPDNRLNEVEWQEVRGRGEIGRDHSGGRPETPHCSADGKLMVTVEHVARSAVSAKAPEEPATDLVADGHQGRGALRHDSGLPTALRQRNRLRAGSAQVAHPVDTTPDERLSLSRRGTNRCFSGDRAGPKEGRVARLLPQGREKLLRFLSDFSDSTDEASFPTGVFKAGGVLDWNDPFRHLCLEILLRPFAGEPLGLSQ